MFKRAVTVSAATAEDKREQKKCVLVCRLA